MSKVGWYCKNERYKITAKMRTSLVLASTFVAVAFGQPATPVPELRNVVPQDAMNGAVARAIGTPRLPVQSARPPVVLRTQPMQPVAKTCAIPLLNAPGKPTHDPIARRKPSAAIDPKMAKAPAVPACPANWNNPAKP
jgi:hypothetical protein